MQMKLDELWQDTLEIKVSDAVETYLLEKHPEYKECHDKRNEILEVYPMARKFLKENQLIDLTLVEYESLIQYLHAGERMAQIEREYHYYFGQSLVFPYGQMLKQLQCEVSPSRTAFAQRRNKLLDMLAKQRNSDAEMENLMSNPKYRKTSEEVLEEGHKLSEMDISKEVKEQIDRYVSAITANWVQYGELIYQYGMQDIIALLNGE